MTRVDTVVRGGTVVTATGAFEAAVAIAGEQIVGVGPEPHLPPADDYIDTSGKYVLPGADADLLIIDPLAKWTIRADELIGNAGYTNYEGWSVTGKPWMTMLRGAVLLLDGELRQGSGYGEFLPAGTPTPPVVVPVR